MSLPLPGCASVGHDFLNNDKFIRALCTGNRPLKEDPTLIDHGDKRDDECFAFLYAKEEASPSH